MNQILNISCYKFVALPDAQDLRQPCLDNALARQLKGTILIAEEGINFFLAGRIYEYIILKNTTANSVTVSGGTTPGGVELFDSVVVAGNTSVPVTVALTPSVNTPFYLSSANWNSASLNIKTISDEA